MKAKPRHKRKRLIHEHEGEVVHVTRLLPSGEVTEYSAVLRFEVDGRALLERIRFLHAFARIGAYDLFTAACDLPIAGFPDWFLISGFIVEISRHTSEQVRGRSYTRIVMDMLGYRGGE